MYCKTQAHYYTQREGEGEGEWRERSRIVPPRFGKENTRTKIPDRTKIKNNNKRRKKRK
jgi:hypothetical protein